MIISEYNKNLKEYLDQNKNKNLYKLYEGLYNVNIFLIKNINLEFKKSYFRK